MRIYLAFPLFLIATLSMGCAHKQPAESSTVDTTATVTQEPTARQTEPAVEQKVVKPKEDEIPSKLIGISMGDYVIDTSGIIYMATSGISSIDGTIHLWRPGSFETVVTPGTYSQIDKVLKRGTAEHDRATTRFLQQ